MAKILPRYDWSYTSKRTENARSRNYPWDEWLDGRIRRLFQGEDFDNPPESVVAVIRTTANRKGVKVRVRAEKIDGDDTIVLQAHTDDARNMERGVTKSPSKAAVEAAREANGLAPTKAVSKRTTKAVKAPAKPSVNGNASKRPAKRIVRAGA